MPAAYTAPQFKVFKVSGDVCFVRITARKIRLFVEVVAIVVFTLSTPLAIWEGTGQKAVVTLVAAVVLLLKLKYYNFGPISKSLISRKATRMVASQLRRRKSSDSRKA